MIEIDIKRKKKKKISFKYDCLFWFEATDNSNMSPKKSADNYN